MKTVFVLRILSDDSRTCFKGKLCVPEDQVHPSTLELIAALKDALLALEGVRPISNVNQLH